jgi:hypothetical protein
LRPMAVRESIMRKQKEAVEKCCNVMEVDDLIP